MGAIQTLSSNVVLIHSRFKSVKTVNKNPEHYTVINPIGFIQATQKKSGVVKYARRPSVILQHVVLRAICRRYERRRTAYWQRHYKSGDDASLSVTKLQHFVRTENFPESDKNNTTRSRGKISK
jgi:hypothetical protein